MLYAKLRNNMMVGLKMKCNGLHPKRNECAICFAEKHGEICIDKKRKTYFVCDEHLKWFDKKKVKK
jgi:hypothetical protein